jgi:hypothetical protein
MKSKRRVLAIVIAVFAVASLIGLFGPTEEARAAQDSKGTEFWVVFMQNLGVDYVQLFITSDVNTSGTVEVPGLAWSQTFTVVADTTTAVNIPTTAVLSGTGIQNKGIHVTAEEEVTIYGLNRRSYTTDAYMALPVDVLNVKYYVLAYANTTYHSSDAEEFAIVAPYDNTTVKYTIPGQATQTIVLNKGQAFQSLRTGTNGHQYTGTYIESDKPVAVFGGNQCTNIPWNGNVAACDHLVEQIPPLATWGKLFYSVPLATRRNGDTFMILAGADGTEVRINGTLEATLNAGQFREQIIDGRSVIETSQPSLVGQYSNSSDYDDVTSDPFMMIVPPIEQALNHYTFSTPGAGFGINYVNVVAPDSIVGNILLDGLAINPALFSPIGATGFSGAQVPVTVGSHTITGPQPFGIHSYGFASYDSYGYPGGMAFEFINPVGDANPPICEGQIISDVYYGTARDDRPTEDINGNGVLDPGEDLNGNGQIDEDTGIFFVELISGTNVTLTVDTFTPGDPTVSYRVERIDPGQQGTATVRAKDGAGNSCQVDIVLGGAPQQVCDVNNDGQVDIFDIQAIGAARGTTNPLYDIDGDGLVTTNDARQCVLECDNPRCAP